MERKHSKGPWGSHAAPSSDAYNTRMITDEQGRTLASVRYTSATEMGDEEGRANAKLIAVAPEMLEAIQAILHNFTINKQHKSGLNLSEVEAGINILSAVVTKATHP